jgi:carbon monoxide dehydrogenase subunit G
MSLVSTRAFAGVAALVLVVLAARPAAVFAVGDEDGWTQELDEDGMSVSSRRTPGAAVHEVRIVADVDAPPRAVCSVVADHERTPETIPRVAEARVVAREGNVTWVYERIDVPVLSDRDYTTRVVEEPMEAPPGGYRIRFEGTADRGPPPRPGVVRIEVIRGAWEFVPVAGGRRTRVTYTILVDPGGMIPSFIANIAARRAIPDVIRALRRWAPTPRYAGGGP